MISHIFKIIWNSKRSNALVMGEIFISFIVLFIVTTVMLHNYNLYNKSLGFKMDNIWYMNIPPSNDTIQKASQVKDLIYNRLEALPQVSDISFSRNGVPYQPLPTSDLRMVSYNGRVVRVREWEVDDQFLKTMSLTLLEGRWLQIEDKNLLVRPIVINKQLQEKLFSQEPYLGKIVEINDDKYKIVGLIEDYRQAENVDPEPGFFLEMASQENVESQESLNNANQSINVLLKLKPNIALDFGEKLVDEVSTAIDNGNGLITIDSLENKRRNYLRSDFIIGSIMLVVCSFLIGNVIIGLFGVLWQKINRRYYEIGVRRAVGATEKDIYLQMVGEVIVLTTISILPASFLSIQFLIFDPFGFEFKSYFLGLLFTAIIMYLLVILCSLYPSYRGAKVHPTIALQTE